FGKLGYSHYFYRQHYRVVDLRIGKIEGVALSEKTYMGSPGYVVEIPTITLKPNRIKVPISKKETD
ncbi:MAG TPA: hypothetical protein DCP92_20545, partial [Nitrospiraceae bacterium]|nr:hypothetical protein [Nitrospiraceae bacterium]